MNKNENKWIVILSVALIIALSGLYLTGLQLYKLREYIPIMQAASIIENNYYYYDKDTDQEKLVENAIDGMVDGIGDKYAQYYTASEYRDLQKSQNNEYRGIGILVGVPGEEGAEILRVYAGSPMDTAGARSGDLILKVNGTPVGGMPLNDMLDLFSTDPYAEDSLLVRRDGKQITFTAKKADVYVPAVTYEMLQDGTGYIRIASFSGNVAKEMSDAVDTLLEMGMRGAVLDLRNNPGGNLDAVLRSAELFLSKGKLIVSVMTRNEEETKYYSTADGKENFPAVVLVNGNSASAAELFTGALRDNGRAIVVGEKTFGKGIVQSFFKVRSTAGYVKLTTDVYFTPGGVCIHKKGIKPDIEAELPEELASLEPEQIRHEEDTQLQMAVTTLNVQREMQEREEESNG